MPQATNDLREKMIQRFGDIDISGPLDFLLSRGYTEQAGLIRGPANHISQADEWECIDFLFQEWDFAYTGDQPND
jgi:hypothetical protein